LKNSDDEKVDVGVTTELKKKSFGEKGDSIVFRSGNRVGREAFGLVEVMVSKVEFSLFRGVFPVSLG